MVSNKYKFIVHGYFDIMLCMGSSISCSQFVFINEMKYAFYKHYSVSLSVIDLDRGGLEMMKLQPSLDNIC